MSKEQVEAGGEGCQKRLGAESGVRAALGLRARWQHRRVGVGPGWEVLVTGTSVSEKQRPGYPVWWQQAAGPDGIRRLVRAAGRGDGPDNPRTRRRGRESDRAVAGIAGRGGGSRWQPRGQGERRGRVGLPCGTRGDAGPWPGLVDPGGEAEPGRAGQARTRALGCPGGSGLCGRAGRRRGGGAGPGPGRAPPRGGAVGVAKHGAG